MSKVACRVDVLLTTGNNHVRWKGFIVFEATKHFVQSGILVLSPLSKALEAEAHPSLVSGSSAFFPWWTLSVLHYATIDAPWVCFASSTLVQQKEKLYLWKVVLRYRSIVPDDWRQSTSTLEHTFSRVVKHLGKRQSPGNVPSPCLDHLVD